MTKEYIDEDNPYPQSCLDCKNWDQSKVQCGIPAWNNCPSEVFKKGFEAGLKAAEEEKELDKLNNECDEYEWDGKND